MAEANVVKLKERPRRIQESDVRQNGQGGLLAVWTLVLPEGVDIDSLLEPGAWANVARNFSPSYHNKIVVLNEEHTLYAEYYVRAVQSSQLIVAPIIEPIRFGPKKLDEPTGLITKWNVGRGGYDVIRKSDKQVVQEGSKFPTKELALEWIETNLKQFGA